MNKNIPFYFIIISVFIAVVSVSLLSDGMFMDGLYYATISKNLANGHGSFWNLHFTKTLHYNFYGHPPLAMVLQSFFFKIFGNTILTERLYSIIMCVITGYIIVAIWKNLAPEKQKPLAWIPLLLWLSVPVVLWGYANNMLENTMTVFVTLSVLFLIKSMQKHRFLNLFTAGIFLFAGFLTKGFVALFPWSFLFLFWIIAKKISFKRCITDSLFFIIATIFPLVIIYFFNHKGIDFLYNYINKQVIGSINNTVTVDSRFFIIQKLFKELIPAISVIICFLIIMRIKRIKSANNNLRTFVFLFVFGLTGVLPITISLKQSGFYILAVYPFFSIALALLIAPHLSRIYAKINTQTKTFRLITVFSIILLCASIVFASLQTKKTGRDNDMLHDIYILTEIIPQDSIIGITPNLHDSWSLHGYFARLKNISLDAKKIYKHKYFITTNDKKDKIPGNYTLVDTGTKKYVLFCKDD